MAAGLMIWFGAILAIRIMESIEEQQMRLMLLKWPNKLSYNK